MNLRIRILVLCATILAIGLGTSRAQPGAPPASRAGDEALIRGVAEQFARAFNAGDAKALADLFTEDAEMIDENGDRVQGRDHLRDLFAAMFKDRAGARLAVTVDSLRFLGPDAAKEEGHTKLTFPGTEAAVSRRYTVLYVKQEGHWLHASVREELDRSLTPHDRLKELEWMVGDWIDESADSTVNASCRWSPDGNFLLRDFQVLVQGKPAMSVTQRIGWDPLTKQIKSWVFDSEGGHGEGTWSREGDTWFIKASGVLPDGRVATGTHVIARSNANTVRWLSRDRSVAGQVVPEHEEYTLVRKAPAPKSR